ncbi:MAG: ABC transporter permease, partial [Gemmatimonadota bacterium]
MRRSLEAWTRDFTHATRSLLRAPGFTLVTVATLALAIGSNTAIFSVVDAVLLDPLPFRDADRLVSIRGSAPGSDLPEEFSLADEVLVHYRDNASRLEGLGAFNTGQTTVRAEDRVDRLFVALANASLFTTLDVTPVLGRLPVPEDGEDVAVISHSLWTSWFGGDPSVIGRTVEVSGDLQTVIGVMGPDFRFPTDRIALWVHGRFEEEEMDLSNGGAGGLGLVGRMTPGTEHEALAAELATLVRRVPERFGGSPEYVRLIGQHRPVVRSLEAELVGDVAGPLWLLLGTVAVVLLIACANVANLFIARAESRRLDLAVRQALGAGRAGLVRTQMAEALLLAAAGGTAGALLAWAGVP